MSTSCFLLFWLHYLDRGKNYEYCNCDSSIHDTEKSNVRFNNAAAADQIRFVYWLICSGVKFKPVIYLLG